MKKMFQRRFLIIALLVLAGLWIPRLAFAAWPGDPKVNVPICTASEDQRYPKIVNDGFDGAIITWEDKRSSVYGDIYAQHVDTNGIVQWTVDGIAICTASSYQRFPKIASDGANGAIIVWEDRRHSLGEDHIYAQRVNASGAVLWPTNGIAISTAVNCQDTNPQIISNGAWGAIITWEDFRNSNDRDIYAQRVDASGTILWAINGVAISTAEENQYRPKIISDGMGGAIITWTSGDIYAQRVDANGAVKWTPDGVPICIALGDQGAPTIVGDGSGGAIITWEDGRSGTYHIYAQCVNASGVVQWTTDGVPICIASGNQKIPQLTSDNFGGAIITWQDSRSGNFDIYAQRVNTSGTVEWTSNGVAISTAEDRKDNPKIASDGVNGAIITWCDRRTGGNDIYAQRVSASGVVQWTANGVPISTASGNQEIPQLTSDDSGGAIITWQDARAGGIDDIYAQRIFSDSSLPVTLSLFIATAFDGKVTLRWRTATETNNLGFNVYRNDSKGGKYVKVNARLIAGAGSDATPHDYSFTDENIVFGKTYYYYIEDVDFLGKTNKSHIIEVTVGKQAQTMLLIPPKFALLQNFPNPFNPETWIPYQLANDSFAIISIYNAKGQIIRTISLGTKHAGVYFTKDKAAYWDGRNNAGEEVASGMYFYTLQAGNFRATRKMIIEK